MTPRNQMYSVLTRETTWLRVYLLFYATLGLMTGWLLADACEIFGHKRAAKANALTYEDGLALANKRLRKPLPKSAREEVEAMAEIAWRESRFNPKMQNPTSTSSGLYGFLDSTYRSYGGKTDDPLEQTRMAWYYVWDRYGTAERALAFHRRNGYY